MKQLLESLFGASSKEVIGFSTLLILLLLVLFIPRVARYFSSQPTAHTTEDQLILDSLVNELEKGPEPEEIILRSSINPQPFDPNQVSVEELVSLGFTETISSRIINYRNKGGRFRQAEDLFKIYSIDSSLVSFLIPYIEIQEQVVKSSMKAITERQKDRKPLLAPNIVKKELPSFDINRADTAMLQTIKGIGSVLSKRIIDFRDNLGGFINTNQVFEVYNLDSAVAKLLVEKSFIENSFKPKAILINEADLEALAAHPYISWQQARLIAAFRNQHGDFKNMDDLIKVYGVEESDIDRFVSYISWSSSN